MQGSPASQPYHEPSITTIITLSGFLVLLNTLNYVLDKLVYCGLIGQVFLGIVWGTPGAKWLSEEMETSVMQLGYLGLIMIVYEGGLSTSYKSLKANLLLSTGVAITGIVTPIILSFTLLSLVSGATTTTTTTPLQAFAAGAALCSTSLGTTFTVLGTSGLCTTRLGVVLTSAAMMDDVVGLVMVQVISTLGGGGDGGDGFTAVHLLRPILVSLGVVAVVVPAACKFIARPVTLRLNAMREASPGWKLDSVLRLRQTALCIHTCWLLGLVVGATFAGTSSLVAAYVAGATVSWWDLEVPHVAVAAKVISSKRQKKKKKVTKKAGGDDGDDDESSQPVQTRPHRTTGANVRAGLSGAAVESPLAASNAPEKQNQPAAELELASRNSGADIYEYYYKQTTERILKPVFFSSIGFSIPITRMFSGPVVWRGVVYTSLMIISKFLCGIWLLSFASPLNVIQRLVVNKTTATGEEQSSKIAPGAQCAGTASESTSVSKESRGRTANQSARGGADVIIPLQPLENCQPGTIPTNILPEPEMPVSVYPACILGCAMIARGEIGFLISALAESTGIFGSSSGGGGSGTSAEPSELFLIVTWAISLCTIIGPVCVGLLVKRLKRLEMQSGKGTTQGGRNVLGAWGLT